MGLPYSPPGIRRSAVGAYFITITSDPLAPNRTIGPGHIVSALSFASELAVFPAGAHDDAVDSTTQALNYLRVPREPGIFTWMRQELEAAGITQLQYQGK
jgi:hypothetical protein